MKTLVSLALPFALVSCGTLATSVESVDSAAAVERVDSDDRVEWVDYGEDLMANPQYLADMMASGTPGPQHETLASHAGTWKVDGKFWMAPGADSMPMTATATIESLFGGRYTVEHFKSDFMGMPFEGRLVQGFDNVTQQYWSLWSDNMSTGYMLSHGTETSPGHIDYHGTATDVLTPTGRPVRMTITNNGDGSYTMRMFDTREDTDEFQSMELRYSRG